ncbi:MAG: response regulator [Pseudomonadota bacterium]
MTKPTLIVDDSLTVRSDLGDAFLAAGMPTLACASAAEARAVLSTQSVGLIILDVVLPDGDGVELLREIRATTKGANIPVLILSTEAEVRDRIRGMTMGSNDYVGKPYDLEYILTRARELLGKPNGNGASTSALTRVLIIDDSLTFRERLGELLQGQGFAVLTAASGEEGLRSAALHRPDAVVVDGVLPGIDGSTVVRKLRLDATLHHTPCILLTGSQDLGAELRALESGADAFVRKDEDLDVILARISAVLRNINNVSRATQTSSLLGPKKILAVDDSETYLHELADILRGEGYDVILAHSGEEALEMVDVQSVDCILLDRLMPGLGGTETCRRIKASPKLRDIPLIMLTAMEDRDAMIEGLSTGADDYVLKSNEVDVLKARLRAQLRRKQFEDESRRVRAELMNRELEASEARAAHQLFESRATLLSVLEKKNSELEQVNEQSLKRQAEIAEKNLQLEHASRLKSEFLANMSHELRTPLNAIIGFSSALQQGLAGALNEKQEEFTRFITEGGKHLLSLINDILDLSKIESGTMSLTLEPININALLESSLNVVREKAVNHQIHLRLEVQNVGWIMADERKTKQILYNLLSNAVKFTGDGGTVTLQSRDARCTEIPLVAGKIRGNETNQSMDRFLALSVSDTGIGIAHADLDRLFQPFVQLDAGLSRKYQGTGLGLALVKQLVELHGGYFSVQSELGMGSTFKVLLPLVVAEETPKQDDGRPT